MIIGSSSVSSHQYYHCPIPSYLSEQTERLQKRVLRITFPSLSYREALPAADCVRLDDNRQRLCLNLFQKINSNGDNKLNPLIPNSRLSEHGRPLRNSDSFQFLNVVRTDLSAVFSQR
jgi:hypothetical protein